jgi:hypothetical protein
MTVIIMSSYMVNFFNPKIILSSNDALALGFTMLLLCFFVMCLSSISPILLSLPPARHPFSLHL